MLRCIRAHQSSSKLGSSKLALFSDLEARMAINGKPPIVFLAALFNAMVAFGAWAGHQSPATSISISNTQALAFGRFAAGSGGSVVINPNGSRSASGGVVLISSGTGAAAQFRVSGDANLTYVITLPANDIVVLTSGAQTMAVNNFSSSPNETGQLGSTGSQALVVGATLGVSANQATGSYSGSFDVFVDYN